MLTKLLQIAAPRLLRGDWKVRVNSEGEKQPEFVSGPKTEEVCLEM